MLIGWGSMATGKLQFLDLGSNVAATMLNKALTNQNIPPPMNADGTPMTREAVMQRALGIDKRTFDEILKSENLEEYRQLFIDMNNTIGSVYHVASPQFAATATAAGLAATAETGMSISQELDDFSGSQPLTELTYSGEFEGAKTSGRNLFPRRYATTIH